MSEGDGSTRTFLNEGLEDPTLVAQIGQQIPEPPLELHGLAMRQNQTRKRLPGLTELITPTLYVEHIAGTALDETTKDEQAARSGVRLGPRVQVGPLTTADAALGAPWKRHRLGRATALDSIRERIPVDLIKKRGPASKTAKRLPQSDQMPIVRCLGVGMNTRLPDTGVCTRGIAGRERVRVDHLPDTSLTARRAHHTLYLDLPRRPEDDKFRIRNENMSGHRDRAARPT